MKYVLLVAALVAVPALAEQGDHENDYSPPIATKTTTPPQPSQTAPIDQTGYGPSTQGATQSGYRMADPNIFKGH
jgi:hypothetical protein